MAEIILDRLLEASIQGVIAIAVVGLIVTLVRRLSPKFRCWLWRLTALKLIVSLVAVASVPLLPAKEFTANEGWAQPSWAIPIQDAIGAQTARTTVAESSTLGWPTVLVYVWLIGITVLLASRIANEITCRAKIFRCANSFISESALTLAECLGLRRPPSLFVSDEVRSPLVIGLWRPAIVLPRTITGTAEELEMALAHEMAHIGRKDLPWQAAMSLTSIVFWFLPPAHWIGKLAKAEAEMACDRLALELTQTQSANYSRLLVHLSSHTPLPSAVIGMAARSRRQLERRILALKHRFAKPHGALLAVATLLLTPALIPWQAVAQTSPTTAFANDADNSWAKRYFPLHGADAELGITAEQRKLFDAHEKQANREVRALGQKLEDMKRAAVSDKERIAYDQKVRMPMFRRHTEERWAILTPEQQKRQKQLVCQYLGPMILATPDLAKLVGLSDAQRQQIQEIDQRYRSFRRTQDRGFWDLSLSYRSYVAVKIRDLTDAENRQLERIRKELYEASGSKREELFKKQYEILRRSVKYIENKKYDGKQFLSARVAAAKSIMNDRRATFARLSKEALSLLSERQKVTWASLQGKAFEFKRLDEPNQIVFSYR
jgi:beta-lactamase regulating signal transducer with metallopeptidase domain